MTVPEVSLDISIWLETQRENISLALGLMPFAGIAFLWFLGVIYDRMGDYEDRFFSTLLFGSGIIYVALMFVASSMLSGILIISIQDPSILIDNRTILIVRSVASLINTVYALRMAGMFMIVFATICIRTGVMPRWLVFITYLSALTLLFSVRFTIWITMIFPSWVFLVSVYILITNYRRQEK
ncbi:hypothetical protein [[Eubacterium] cellulosolvens]